PGGPRRGTRLLETTPAATWHSRENFRFAGECGEKARARSLSARRAGHLVAAYGSASRQKLLRYLVECGECLLEGRWLRLVHQRQQRIDVPLPKLGMGFRHDQRAPQHSDGISIEFGILIPELRLVAPHQLRKDVLARSQRFRRL